MTFCGVCDKNINYNNKWFPCYECSEINCFKCNGHSRNCLVCGAVYKLDTQSDFDRLTKSSTKDLINPEVINFFLGIKYMDSGGLKDSFKCFAKSAVEDFPPAQVSIGNALNDGIGVEIDHDEAFKWYLKAGVQGYGEAWYCIGMSYLKGHGVKQSREEAYVWFKKSISKGYYSAYLNLAYAYEKGLLGKANLQKGREMRQKYYEKTRETGGNRLSIMN
jgi:TPR repeat protein